MVKEYLTHHGIKGQKWGVRRFQNPDGTLTEAGKKHQALEGVSGKTRREAKRDAGKAAKAKMYYGEGAGVRRRQINATVEQRSKDPSYKKAYDYYAGKQDMAKRASQARAERKSRDIAEAVFPGFGFESASIMTLGVIGAISIAKATGADKVVAQYAKQTVNDLLNSQASSPYIKKFK